QSYGEGFPFFNTLKVSIYTKYFTLPSLMPITAFPGSDFLFSPLFYCEQRKIGGDKKKGGI
ncbi:hypothetical protein, partial [Limosilactobacillus fermentum]|uniref:hypothetical protein n=1 Tax=Limosilactobacillus fermentum TaxID=1613 RepID=UPI001D13D54B